MYYVVTGAAGFIGSNIIQALNSRGITEIIAVDNLTKADKFKNLVDCEIADYIDKLDFMKLLHNNSLDGAVTAVLHEGACSDTMEIDGRYMMENNYRYSMDVLDFCQENQASFLYASSASVYGSGTVFSERREHEAPLNVYGYSKFLFDQAVRRIWEDRTSQIVGFRYFNVYGQREQHKGRMASVAYHFFNQYMTTGKVKLFEGCAGYGNGEQSRDFVSIEDVVKVNMWFLDNPDSSGIFNLGTGRSQPFNDVAIAVINQCRQHQGEAALDLCALQQQGLIEYIDFPEALKGKYQSFTQADISALRAVGYAHDMLSVADGTARYVDILNAQYHA